MERHGGTGGKRSGNHTHTYIHRPYFVNMRVIRSVFWYRLRSSVATRAVIHGLSNRGVIT